MAGAGLIVEAIFSRSGLVPHHRSIQIAPTHFQWNYTTFLNLVFLAVFAGLYWLGRNQTRLGGGTGYAIDPICGMQVRTATAPAQRIHAGRPVWFCCDRCAERFDRDPERYINAGPSDMIHPEESEEPELATDPVCHMQVDPATADAMRNHDGRNYFFCAVGCAESFEADPAKYLKGSGKP
jgi:YHS domain-containing protein